MPDRGFDNYGMAPMTAIVEEHLGGADGPDRARCAGAAGPAPSGQT